MSLLGGIASVAMLIMGLAAASPVWADDAQPPIEVRIGVLAHKTAPPPLYEVDPTPPEAGSSFVRKA